MKITTTTRLALALVSLAGLALSAQAVPSLVINELSSTTLTYTWTGQFPQSGTVTATTPNNWTINIADAIITGLGGTQDIFIDWVEANPADPNLVNHIRFFQYGPAANGSTVTVLSDNPIDPLRGYPTMQNGQTYTFNFADAYTATFNDLGDSSVPDGGATPLGLLGLALAAIVAFRRFMVSPSFALAKSHDVRPR
jgi:hypothetical protein